MPAFLRLGGMRPSGRAFFTALRFNRSNQGTLLKIQRHMQARFLPPLVATPLMQNCVGDLGDAAAVQDRWGDERESFEKHLIGGERVANILTGTLPSEPIRGRSRKT